MATTDTSLLREAMRSAAGLLRETTAARLALQGIKQRIDLEALRPESRDEVAARLARVPDPEPIAWRELEGVLREAWGAGQGPRGSVTRTGGGAAGVAGASRRDRRR